MHQRHPVEAPALSLLRTHHLFSEKLTCRKNRQQRAPRLLLLFPSQGKFRQLLIFDVCIRALYHVCCARTHTPVCTFPQLFLCLERNSGLDCWSRVPWLPRPAPCLHPGWTWMRHWHVWALVPLQHRGDKEDLCPPSPAHPHWSTGPRRHPEDMPSESVFTPLTRQGLAAGEVMVPGCLCHSNLS